MREPSGAVATPVPPPPTETVPTGLRLLTSTNVAPLPPATATTRA